MPTREELDQYYLEGLFWSHVEGKTPFDIPTYHHQALARIEFLRSRATLQPNFRLLDIGAGFGVLEANLKKAFPFAALFAVEPDPKAHTALQKLGVTVKNDLSSFNGETFDLLILSHVLEHINNPVQYLKDLHTFCHTNTQVFIELPNEDHLYKGYLEPHVLFFSPQTLSLALQKGGFRVKTVEACGTLRSVQKSRNARLESRERLIRRIPLRRTLQRLKKRCVKWAQKPIDPSGAPDPYECQVYGTDRIWIRCLATPES